MSLRLRLRKFPDGPFDFSCGFLSNRLPTASRFSTYGYIRTMMSLVGLSPMARSSDL